MRRLTLCLTILLMLLTACGAVPNTADTGTTASTEEATPVTSEEEATPVVEEEPVASSSPTASPLPTAEATQEVEAATMTPAPMATVKATSAPVNPTPGMPMEDPLAPEVIFIYEREGGFAGFCDTVTVYATEATWVNCNGRAMTFPLDPATTEELRKLATGYSAFKTDSEDNPGGSDSMRLGIRFNGTGSAAVTSDVEATLHRIGQEILQKAYQAMQ